MTEDDTQAERRRALLADMFGAAVPTGLGGALLGTADVAALFQVSARTVSEWARRGRIPSVRTPGGHRRYPADEIRRVLAETDARTRDARTGDATPAGRRPAVISHLHDRTASG